MADGRFISEKDWPDFRAMLRAYRTGELLRRDQPAETAKAQPQSSRLVVLLEDLVSGGEARAERVRRERAYQVQDVMVVGHLPTGLGELPPAFTLSTMTGAAQGETEEENEEPLPEIPVTATAAEAFKIWTGSDSPIRKILMGVSLGTATVEGDVLPIMRWRLQLQPPAGGELYPLLKLYSHTMGETSTIVVQRCQYVGTGSFQTVFSVIPTGDPTPIRAGSQCGLRLFDGTGWGVTEAEPRKFEPGPELDYPYGYG